MWLQVVVVTMVMVIGVKVEVVLVMMLIVMLILMLGLFPSDLASTPLSSASWPGAGLGPPDSTRTTHTTSRAGDAPPSTQLFNRSTFANLNQVQVQEDLASQKKFKPS